MLKHCPIDRHERVALQFSGGKDSLACLKLCEPWWSKITLVWANTGDAFPETVALVERAREKVGGFVEAVSDVIDWTSRYGWPADVLPVSASGFGRVSAGGGDGPLIAPSPACCAANIWAPMQRKTMEIGATLVIRGQKGSDRLSALVSSGDVVDGVEYWFPLEAWTDEDVFTYLGDMAPDHYESTETSLDCRHCTAYLAESAGKIAWMRDHYPDVHAEVTRRIELIESAVLAEMQVIDRALGRA